MKTLAHCSTCKHNPSGYYCLKLKIDLENGYAKLAHSRSCGEQLSEDEKRVPVGSVAR